MENRSRSAYNGHFESTCYHPLLLFKGKRETKHRIDERYGLVSGGRFAGVGAGHFAYGGNQPGATSTSPGFGEREGARFGLHGGPGAPHSGCAC